MEAQKRNDLREYRPFAFDLPPLDNGVETEWLAHHFVRHAFSPYEEEKRSIEQDEAQIKQQLHARKKAIDEQRLSAERAEWRASTKRARETLHPDDVPWADSLNDIETVTSDKTDHEVYKAISIDRHRNEELFGQLAYQLLPALEKFTNLRCLTLRHVGLSSLDSLRMSTLMYLDVQHNEISDMQGCFGLVSRCRDLDWLDVRNNPVAEDDESMTKKEKEDLFVRTLAGQRHSIRVINGTVIAPEKRVEAALSAATSDQEERVSLLRFDRALCQSQPVEAMKLWTPETITSLNLSRTGISTLCMSSFVALRSLNVSENKIRILTGFGLEFCEKLEEMDLSRNELGRREDLHLIASLPSLLTVDLHENTHFEEYRGYLVYHSNRCARSAACSGLIRIDDTDITDEEIDAAVRRFGTHEERRSIARRTTLSAEVVDEDSGALDGRIVPAQSRTLAIVGAGIRRVEVARLSFLTFLDLRGNQLRHVTGLPACTKLQYLDLRGNPALDIDYVLEQIRGMEWLAWIALKHGGGSEDSYEWSTYHARCLASIVQFNVRAAALDGKPIPIDARCQVYRSLGYSETQCDGYRFNLAVLRSVTPALHRRYDIESVKVGNRYSPYEVVRLDRLHYQRLRAPACHFSRFVNMTVLNLSHNLIEDVTTFASTGFNKLMVLDLSHNRIANRLEEVASFVDGIRSLEVFCIHDNPCMQPDYDTSRTHLLCSLREVRCRVSTLRVLDSPITHAEREVAWRVNQGVQRKGQLRVEERALLPRLFGTFDKPFDCELRGRHLLCASSSDRDLGRIALRLSGARVRSVPPHAIELTCADGRVFILTANGRGIADRWLEDLASAIDGRIQERVLQHARLQARRKTPSGGLSAGLSSEDHPDPDLPGRWAAVELKHLFYAMELYGFTSLTDEFDIKDEYGVERWKAIAKYVNLAMQMEADEANERDADNLRPPRSGAECREIALSDIAERYGKSQEEMKKVFDLYLNYRDFSRGGIRPIDEKLAENELNKRLKRTSSVASTASEQSTYDDGRMTPDVSLDRRLP